MQAYFINVGQGNSTLIESDGHYMFIDTGESNQADTVIFHLRSQNVSTLGYVTGTHPHSGHIGGLDKVIKVFDIGRVILPSKEHITRTFEDLLDAIADRNLKIIRPVAGDIYELGDASFQVLAPNQSYDDDLNNWSVDIRLVYGNAAFVFTGDAEINAETNILVSGLTLHADVLKAGRHGSRTSNSDSPLNGVQPFYAVISYSGGNTHGRPHQETMKELEDKNIQVYRTDTQDNVMATTDGTGATWVMEE